MLNPCTPVCAVRIGALAALTISCSSSAAECVFPPCPPLPPAVTVGVTSSVSGAPLTSALVQAAGYSSPLPCNQAPGSTCAVLGEAGTYQLDVGAPGFTTVHLTIAVQGTSVKCGCATVQTEHRDVVLVPVASRNLEVRTSVDRSVILPGDTVTIRVVARNLTNATIVVGGALTACVLSYIATGPGPVNNLPGPILCAESHVPPLSLQLSIPPGDSLVGTGTWPGRTYVSTSSQVQGSEGPSPPGDYELRAWVWFDLRDRMEGGAARVTVRVP